ncbi:hypothetical protein [Vibrio owensii]|uniref:hypothetical protein n=1 Tax=Vibrio harveyi group TaxID=717610 RepID=UPI003CC6AA3F
MRIKIPILLLAGAISLPALAGTYLIKAEGRYSSWESAESTFSEWNQKGERYDCVIDSPLSTNQTSNFTQNWKCKQDYTQQVTLREYDRFADTYRDVGTRTDEKTEIVNDPRSISVSASGWTNTGGVYSCSGYSPATSTVRNGKSFTQSRNCRQNQVSKVTHYLNGAKVYEFSNQRYINASQSRGATGNRSPIWVYCGNEGGRCYFNNSERRTIRYGAGGRYTYKGNMANGTSCSNGVFGDPYHGVAKACWYDK